MITRDFILRQIHQLAQALAQVLFHKQAGETEEVEQVLTEAVEGATGHTLEQIRSLDRDELLVLCSPAGSLNTEKAVALASLLSEDDSVEGRRRALWLFEAALEAGGAVPIDIYDRMDALREP